MLPATLQALGTDIAGSDGLGRRYLLAEKKKKNRWALAAGKAAGIGSDFEKLNLAVGTASLYISLSFISQLSPLLFIFFSTFSLYFFTYMYFVNSLFLF
jgi:hypothetical protein